MLKNFGKFLLSLCLLTLLNRSFLAKGVEKTAVQFLDLGQSDCILILDKSKAVLIDTGYEKYKDKIYKHLQEEGVKELEYIILTHYHEDHFGNIINLCNNIKVKNVLLPKYYVDEERKNIILEKLKNLNVNIEIGSNQWSYKEGNLDLRAFVAAKCDKKNENNNSLIIYGIIDGLKYSFMGDAEAKLEKDFINKKLINNIDVLKVSHHGLHTSTSKVFLKALKPKVAVITSDGVESPSRRVIDNLNKYKTVILRTDEMNNIMIMSYIDEKEERYIRIYNKK